MFISIILSLVLNYREFVIIMKNIIIDCEPTMEDMKRNIIEAGGLLYQYRPCNNNASTVYDIENIKHNVLYAQTPLNMNDPFDSKIGFSTEEFYKDCINMILDAMGLDNSLKMIISVVLKYRMLGNMIELIDKLNKLKQYLISTKKNKHLMGLSNTQFINNHIKSLLGKAPKEIKHIFPQELFRTLGLMVMSIESDVITEEVLESTIKLQSCMDDFVQKIEDIKNNKYSPLFEKFLSQLTITCLTVSGWDNQLMWSHYANSYSGICVEYDLTKMNDFFGFFYPVQYTEKRATVSLADLGIGLEVVDGKYNVVQKEVDIVPLINYLLCKNKCWEYEKKWRIINIGEANTQIFINFPFIKSITFGLNISSDIKGVLLDICKQKKIVCYDLKLGKEDFSLTRELIDLDSLYYEDESEIQHVAVLVENIVRLSKYITEKREMIAEKISAECFDSKFAVDYLEKLLDILLDAYHFKITINKIVENTNEDISVLKEDEEINIAKNAIEEFVVVASSLSSTLEDTLKTIRYGFVVPDREFNLMKQYKKDLRDLSSEISNIEWKI